MPSVKLFTGSVLAGALASVLAIPTAAAQTAGPVSVMVNDEAPLTVPSSPGFSYVAGATTSTLSVTSDGYLLCANVYLTGAPGSTTTMLAPGHLRWSLPAATDVLSVTYTSGALSINKPALGSSLETSLVCHARDAQGKIANPFSAFGDGIFGDSYESVLATQFGNMVNWASAPGFSWDQADWSLVPNDACNFDGTSADTPRVSEHNLCTAATGVRPSIATPTQMYGDRAPTMWTGTVTDGVGWSFIYLARVDVRIGAPTEAPNSGFYVPPLTPAQPADLSNSVTTEIRDGFDSTYLLASGTWCFLNSLPTTLDATVCANAASTSTGTLNGTLAENVTVSLSTPHAPITSFFVAVIRTIINPNPPANNTPVAAVSVMADPGTVRHDGGDGFVGDDVIFGFMPGSTGFPWMQ
jgi:hypothetical protein